MQVNGAFLETIVLQCFCESMPGKRARGLDAWDPGGQEFESPWPHLLSLGIAWVF
ncbi:hypothetical protein PMIT1327_00095 [Prochlorococcus marinus str. MIT 1327]|nr:hypothetical protein PMIT1327_00095 [Prochlorococcus marinus str. MIT 1327]